MQNQKHRSGANSSGDGEAGSHKFPEQDDVNVNNNNNNDSNRGPRLVKQMQLTNSAELESS